MIHTSKLTKTFTVKKEKIQAVKGVDIDVERGELVAFLGPNGAGKSTTLRMLTTLLAPTSGTARVAGVDVVADPAGVRSRIGYIGQGNGGGHSYRVIDELIMQGRFYGMNTTEARARAEQQPLVFLALFGPLLGAAVGAEAFGGESSLQWFLPGVVVMIALFGTTMTGSNLQYELMTGSYERILATPLSRSSLLIGRALKEWAPLVVQGLVIALASIPFGFVFYPLHVLFGLVVIGVFGIGLGALSYALALVTQGKEWVFWGVQQTLLFPLMILSGIMLPIEAGPRWMQVLSLFNPLTYMVNAERELFAGGLGWDTVWGVVAAVITAVVGLAVGVKVIKHSTV